MAIDALFLTDIDRLVISLKDPRCIAAGDLAIATALDSVRKKDYERGLALARVVIPDKSTRYSDHLTLGRILMTSGKVKEAGTEFRQALDLAPSAPETWRVWVEYLAPHKPGTGRERSSSGSRKGTCSWSVHP